MLPRLRKLHFGSLRKNKLLADAIMFTSLIIKGRVLTHTLIILLQYYAKLCTVVGARRVTLLQYI